MRQVQNQAEPIDESFQFEESYKEPVSIQITDDWDTVMDDYYDEYDDFNDIDLPHADDDF